MSVYQKQKEVVDFFLERGFLVSPDFFMTDDGFDISLLDEKLKNKENLKDKPIIIDVSSLSVVTNKGAAVDINWSEFEKSKSNIEKGRKDKAYTTFLDIFNFSNKKDSVVDTFLVELTQDKKEILIEAEEKNMYNIIILNSYFDKHKQREVSDFSLYYNNRYMAIKKILLNRPELGLVTSISRILNKNKKEETTVIGMVYDKSVSKNGNILLGLEDPTGRINIIVPKTKTELYNLAKEVTLDEVIGIVGALGNKAIFTNKIFFPDIQGGGNKKYSEDEVYCAFISDIHVGSKLFLRDEFERFIEWINGGVGSQAQREVALKVKYLFVAGDSVDGVGIYPGQDEELLTKDVMAQYEELSALFDKIRKDVKIILCSGQHDATRLSEPQPPPTKEFAEPIYRLSNITLVSNPSLINIHSSRNFEGFNVLMYHGASFHYYIDNIDVLRTTNPRDNPHHVLRYLLIKRHLAPTHGSTMFIPDPSYDPLVIDRVPDVFVCGDMHRSDVSKYKETILINCSCWQAKTPYQEKTGNNPDPCKVPILNLKTKEVRVIKFLE